MARELNNLLLPLSVSEHVIGRVACFLPGTIIYALCAPLLGLLLWIL